MTQTTGGVQNNQPVTWTYDGLGQLQKEGFPDGASFNWAYATCSLSSCESDAQAFEVISQTTKDVNGAQISTASTYLVGRERCATRVRFSAYRKQNPMSSISRSRAY